MLRVILVLVLHFSLSGCYYMQAAAGQWEVLRKRQPIDELIAADSTPEALAARLSLIDEARDFSISELGLPDNDSYRSYTDLQREYVVWNVFAAEEFALQPETWCYPVAGCVSYRGYFARDNAIKLAKRLSDKGLDVSVGGVAAYSTLGRFDDPILNTMLQWDDVRLVAVLFHELAHQVLYLKGDSAFNESFATAVEEFGVQRWLASRGESQLLQQYTEDRALQQTVMQRVATARDDLRLVYASTLATEEMREKKRARLASLATEIVTLLESTGRDASRWRGAELNNARLITMVLYEGKLPQFRDMLVSCNEDIECFYDAARKAANALEQAENDA